MQRLKQEEKVRTWGILTRCRKFLGTVSKAWEERDRASFEDRCVGACHRGHNLYEEVCADIEYLKHIETYIASKEQELMEEDDATKP